ncbi:metallophosphoesterase family protein [Anatilimnocola floriformis]|uniref:metallophosphoesterase family protein n=1 Tax=Anatilimnocola floriformis TaxID=2948575 RepID=UPI0020C57089|nr:DNA repair exonuclease [Anatilimnocola floriformis]
MRFLHAADVHLDSPLRGLDRYEGAPVELLRDATRQSLEKLVTLAKTERVDFVILAGDLYDGDWQDYNTGVFFVQRMRDLERAGIPVYLIRGNHDAESRITSQLTLPPNVHSFSTEQPETKTLDHLRVALHGQGFARQAEPRNLAASYPPPLANHFNIGVLHTSLDGRAEHACYAPCTVADLVARDYDYWALGHVHQRETVSAARPRIEFPGNTQGRHAREPGAKGCLLVTTSGQQVTTEFRPLDVIRWQVVPVNAAEVENFNDLLEQIQSALTTAVDDAEGRLLAARLEITCPDAVRLSAAADLPKLRAELVARFEKEVWVEKIHWPQFRQTTTATPALSDDATSELRAVLTELQTDLAETQKKITTGECEKLFRNLPAELRSLLPDGLPEIIARAEVLLQTAGQETPA